MSKPNRIIKINGVSLVAPLNYQLSSDTMVYYNTMSGNTEGSLLKDLEYGSDYLANSKLYLTAYDAAKMQNVIRAIQNGCLQQNEPK